MTRLEELQKQLLQLPPADRWQLVQTLLESLKLEAPAKLQRGNLSRLRGIAKSLLPKEEVDAKEDYVTYLIKKSEQI